MDRWVARPTKPPFSCHRTLKDAEADGPYYESAFSYFEGFFDPNRNEVLPAPGPPRTLYIAASHLRSICDAPGSPFVLMDTTEHEKLMRELHLKSAELEEALERIDELEIESERRVRDNHPASVAAIAEAVAAELDERYARKSGRKKAA